MAINVTDLPPKYQAQAVRKYMEQQARRGPTPFPSAQGSPKTNKYHNTPTERVTPAGSVLRFDSQKEARRYDDLIQREQAGMIRDLRLQVDFTLQEAYTDTKGRRVRAIRYKADFTYYQPSSQEGSPWMLVVEDVKSRATRTKEYLLKRKLMQDRLQIEITEV